MYKIDEVKKAIYEELNLDEIQATTNLLDNGIEKRREMIVTFTLSLAKLLQKIYFNSSDESLLPEILFKNLDNYILDKGKIIAVDINNLIAQEEPIQPELSRNELVEQCLLNVRQYNEKEHCEFTGITQQQGKVIVLHSDYLSRNIVNNKTVLETVLREVFHCIQYQCVCKCKDLVLEPLLLIKSREWEDNFLHYVQPWENLKQYEMQVVENDAKVFANYIYQTLPCGDYELFEDYAIRSLSYILTKGMREQLIIGDDCLARLSKKVSYDKEISIIKFATRNAILNPSGKIKDNKFDKSIYAYFYEVKIGFERVELFIKLNANGENILMQEIILTVEEYVATSYLRRIVMGICKMTERIKKIIDNFENKKVTENE